MPKTNFTKVEEALNEGMRKIEVDRLLIIADENAAANAAASAAKPEGEQVEETQQSAEGEQVENKQVESNEQAPKSKVDAAHLQRLTAINHELKVLQKLGEQPYIRLGIDKEEIKKYLKDPVALTSADWEKVKVIKELIAAYKQERKNPGTGTPGTPGTDDDLIVEQRKSQITKRFNINKKWIPLR